MNEDFEVQSGSDSRAIDCGKAGRIPAASARRAPSPDLAMARTARAPPAKSQAAPVSRENAIEDAAQKRLDFTGPGSNRAISIGTAPFRPYCGRFSHERAPSGPPTASRPEATGGRSAGSGPDSGGSIGFSCAGSSWRAKSEVPDRVLRWKIEPFARVGSPRPSRGRA